ncbi:hypothetical protein FBZ96_11658 [Bradyrhizobium stylosanthis]|uniref:Uncharacterized protein n=1 Tax=Bradyrhizobium stylosanthis TaxID=1803665 RepID=A0A560CZG7_9BRAD|nr:hypothetical protein FBZ96_11658 [Bradyrhizobium stylosanthis]
MRPVVVHLQFNSYMLRAKCRDHRDRSEVKDLEQKHDLVLKLKGA